MKRSQDRHGSARVVTRLLALAVAVLVAVAAPRAQQPTYEQFVQELTKTIESKNANSLGDLLKKNQALTLTYFHEICLKHRRAPEEVPAELIETLKAGWQFGCGTSTLDSYERYLSRRSDQAQRDETIARTAEPDAFELFERAKAEKTRVACQAAVDAAKKLATTYDAQGQAVFAANMWSLAGAAAELVPDRTPEDHEAIVEYYRKFLIARDKWQWTTDGEYGRIKDWLTKQAEQKQEMEEAAEKRKEEGYSEHVTGVDAMVVPTAPEEVADLTFEVIKKPHVSPFVRGGPSPITWVAAAVQGTGPAKIPYFTASDLFLVRPNAGKFGVTFDGTELDLDKNPWQQISPSTRFKPTLFHLDAAKTRPYAMWFYLGSDSELLYGMPQNLAPQEESATVYYRSASSWKATIADQTITFFDDNANGKLFEEDPLAYGLRDRTRIANSRDGEPVAAYDGMSIGDSEHVVPLSTFVKLETGWFHLRPTDEGKKVGARPLNPEYFKVGQLQLKWVGAPAPKPEVLVIQGEGDFSGACFDISSDKPLEVPAGRYTLTYGRIVSGKGGRGSEADVYAGAMEPIIVNPGETATVTLGGPFKIDFERKVEGEEVVIDALKITVVGVSGEIYGRINGAPPVPEVLAAKTPDGKGAKTIGEFVAMDEDGLLNAANRYPNMSLDVGFFPMPKGEHDGELVLKVKPPFPDALIGLRQKKNKLFGKLDPIFK